MATMQTFVSLFTREGYTIVGNLVGGFEDALRSYEAGQCGAFEVVVIVRDLHGREISVVALMESTIPRHSIIYQTIMDIVAVYILKDEVGYMQFLWVHTDEDARATPLALAHRSHYDGHNQVSDDGDA